MKKILGISLCALFAVSAANAEIASKLYVDQEVGANESAIEGLTTRVNANEGNITTNTTSIGNLNTSVNTLSGKVTANEGAIAQNTTKINNLDTAIQGMDQTQTTGDYVRYVKQENGDVTAEGGSFDTSVSDESESNKAPTSKAVAAYVKGKVDGLGVTALSGRVDANETAINTLDGRVDAHDTSITNLTTSVNDHNTRITNNANAITALQTTAEGLGALASKDSVATADINDNAVTSAKIVDATIMDADINNDAQIASSKIKFNDTQTAVFGSGITQEHVNKIDANATAITGINSSMTALTGRVAQNETDITALETSVNGLGDLAHKDTVATADIDANAVTSAQIASQTITNDDIAGNAAIESSKIAFNQTQNTVFGSGITSNLVADINSNRTNINAMLTEANGYDTCKTSTDGCTLVVKNSQFYWEAIKRAEGEGAE